MTDSGHYTAESAQVLPTMNREGEQKVANLEARLEGLSKLSTEFAVLLTFSVLIASFGLFQNSAAVIIGAMIIAPLMRPLLGLSLGLLTGDLVLLRRATFTLWVGTIVGLFVSAAVALLLSEIELTAEILARTKPTLLDLGVAIFAGAVGAYCQSNENVLDSFAGVAIAVALVPPLSVVGIGLALNNQELWQGACLLYLTNLVGITVAGSFVFLMLGFASVKRARHGLVFSLLSLFLLCIPLFLSMNELLLENRLSTKIRTILKEKTHTFKDVRLRGIEMRKSQESIEVIATVLTDQAINSAQVKMVQDLLVRELGIRLLLRIRQIPLTEIDSTDPKASSQPGANRSETPIGNPVIEIEEYATTD